MDVTDVVIEQFGYRLSFLMTTEMPEAMVRTASTPKFSVASELK